MSVNFPLNSVHFRNLRGRHGNLTNGGRRLARCVRCTTLSGWREMAQFVGLWKGRRDVISMLVSAARYWYNLPLRRAATQVYKACCVDLQLSAFVCCVDREADEAREREYGAAVAIQSWFRGCRLRAYLR